MTCKDCIHSGLCYKENDYDNFPNRCGDFISESLAIKALHIVDIINEELNPADEDKAIWFDIPHWEEIQERADMRGDRE